MKGSLYSTAPSAGIERVTVEVWDDHGVTVVIERTGDRRFYPYTGFYWLKLDKGE